ncbi:SCO family protein [Rhodanobacter denitrificans]|uniref:SCO family protein n=1 Tax=Rhodanobacter denitrificans TaxID=666685 RepID=UPI0012FD6A5D|nr:SCO family protein [Rhodanobacter denitrificans]UJM90714.1 SCO family protein [Rhodanobacter denitrificans]
MIITGTVASGIQSPVVASAMHMPAATAMAAASSQHRYVVPPITLIDQHGRKVRLDQALAGDKPALVQFFFTSCTTICDVRSAQLVAAAPQLLKANIDIGFYTITIDPDRDTPERLLAFSRQFGTPPPNWHLLTGSDANIRQVQAAFNASDPSADKMMHEPLTFIRGGEGQPWRRIDEIVTTSELVKQIKEDVALAH